MAGQVDDQTRNSLRLVGWLACSWVLLLGMGIVSLKMPAALRARNPVSFDRAIFTSVSVATQTGFPLQYAQPTEFDPAVQWIFAVETLSGALLSLLGGGVLLARAFRLRHTDGQIAAATLAMLGASAVAGALTWHGHESLMRASFRGIGAMAGSGFIFGPPIGTGSPTFVMVIAPLALIGSLGPIVLLELFDRYRKREALNELVVRVLLLAGIAYIGGLVAIATLIAIDGAPFRDAILPASALALGVRGLGLPGQTFSTHSRGILWIVTVLMTIGTGTAGAGGALGFGWLVTTSRGLWARLHRALFLQAILLVIVLLAVLQTEPQLSFESLMLLSTSAAMNVGIAATPISITGWGLIFLSAGMLLGKVLPLFFLLSVVHTKPQAV